MVWLDKCSIKPENVWQLSCYHKPCAVLLIHVCVMTLEDMCLMTEQATNILPSPLEFITQQARFMTAPDLTSNVNVAHIRCQPCLYELYPAFLIVCDVTVHHNLFVSRLSGDLLINCWVAKPQKFIATQTHTRREQIVMLHWSDATLNNWLSNISEFYW